jgi:hypothetical protein
MIGMEPSLSSLFDDTDDLPTMPGVCIMPEEASPPGPHGDPVLEDPSSWEEDTKRVRVMG